MMKSPIAKIFLFLFLLLPGIAAAASSTGGDNVVIWALGGGPALREILEAIKVMTADGGYSTMFRVVALLGFIIMATISSMRLTQKPEHIITFVISILLLEIIMFQAKVDVVIEDPVNQAGVQQWDNFVADVPIGVALPAAFITTMGKGITDLIESSFSGAGNFPVSLSLGGGNKFSMLNAVLQDVGDVKISDPQLRASLANFSRDCFIPRLYLGEKDSRVMRMQDDLWAYMEDTNEGRLTNYMSATHPNGEVLSCEAAYRAITRDLTNKAPSLVKAEASAWKYTDVYNYMDGAIADAMTWLGSTGGGSGADIMKRAAVINTFVADTSQSLDPRTGDLIFNVSVAEAKQAQRAQWRIAAEVFTDTIGYLFIVMQIFIFAMAPIIFLLSIIPGMGKKVVGSYLLTSLWIVTWQPLMAIINFIIAIFTEASIGGYVSDGVTINTLGEIGVHNENLMLAAGFLGTMVPMLSLGMLKGGAMAFTQFTADAVAPAHASRAAANVAAGNLNMGNRQLDNMAANKMDIASSLTAGHMGSTFHNSAGSFMGQQNLGGGQMQMNGGALAYGNSAGVRGDTAVGAGETGSNEKLKNTNDSVGTGDAFQAGDTISDKNTIGDATQAQFAKMTAAEKSEAFSQELRNQTQIAASDSASHDSSGVGALSAKATISPGTIMGALGAMGGSPAAQQNQLQNMMQANPALRQSVGGGLGMPNASSGLIASAAVGLAGAGAGYVASKYGDNPTPEQREAGEQEFQEKLDGGLTDIAKEEGITKGEALLGGLAAAGMLRSSSGAMIPAGSPGVPMLSGPTASAGAPGGRGGKLGALGEVLKFGAGLESRDSFKKSQDGKTNTDTSVVDGNTDSNALRNTDSQNDQTTFKDANDVSTDKNHSNRRSHDTGQTTSESDGNRNTRGNTHTANVSRTADRSLQWQEQAGSGDFLAMQARELGSWAGEDKFLQEIARSVIPESHQQFMHSNTALEEITAERDSLQEKTDEAMKGGDDHYAAAQRKQAKVLEGIDEDKADLDGAKKKKTDEVKPELKPGIKPDVEGSLDAAAGEQQQADNKSTINSAKTSMEALSRAENFEGKASLLGYADGMVGDAAREILPEKFVEGVSRVFNSVFSSGSGEEGQPEAYIFNSDNLPLQNELHHAGGVNSQVLPAEMGSGGNDDGALIPLIETHFPATTKEDGSLGANPLEAITIGDNNGNLLPASQSEADSIASYIQASGQVPGGFENLDIDPNGSVSEISQQLMDARNEHLASPESARSFGGSLATSPDTVMQGPLVINRSSGAEETAQEGEFTGEAYTAPEPPKPPMTQAEAEKNIPQSWRRS